MVKVKFAQPSLTRFLVSIYRTIGRPRAVHCCCWPISISDNKQTGSGATAAPASTTSSLPSLFRATKKTSNQGLGGAASTSSSCLTLGLTPGGAPGFGTTLVATTQASGFALGGATSTAASGSSFDMTSSASFTAATGTLKVLNFLTPKVCIDIITVKFERLWTYIYFREMFLKYLDRMANSNQTTPRSDCFSKKSLSSSRSSLNWIFCVCLFWATHLFLTCFLTNCFCI